MFYYSNRNGKEKTAFAVCRFSLCTAHCHYSNAADTNDLSPNQGKGIAKCFVYKTMRFGKGIFPGYGGFLGVLVNNRTLFAKTTGFYFNLVAVSKKMQRVKKLKKAFDQASDSKYY